MELWEIFRSEEWKRFDEKRHQKEKMKEKNPKWKIGKSSEYEMK
jgi:hypothetical protein